MNISANKWILLAAAGLGLVAAIIGLSLGFLTKNEDLSHTALVICDVQNVYISGSLALKNAVEVVPAINAVWTRTQTGQD